MSRKEILRSALFLLLLAALVLSAWIVLDRKLACNYTKSIHGYFNEPEQSMDVLFFGSSHAYCSMNPLSLWDETGLRSYVLSTQSQPLQATYRYMAESLGTQSPDVLVLELFMASLSLEDASDAVLRDAIDPLPWSRGKAALIRELLPAGQRGSYYFNLAKYHGRWKELSRQSLDFGYLDGRDDFRGYICFTPSRPADCYALDYSGAAAGQLSAESREQLLRMKALAEAKGTELVFFITPYEGAEGDMEMLMAMRNFAADEDILLLDMNEAYDEIGLDGGRDFFDQNHLNLFGADKATRWLGRQLMERCGLEAQPHAADADFARSWEAAGMDKLLALYGN